MAYRGAHRIAVDVAQAVALICVLVEGGLVGAVGEAVAGDVVAAGAVVLPDGGEAGRAADGVARDRFKRKAYLMDEVKVLWRAASVSLCL